MTFQTVEQMQERINILEGALCALEDAINAQATSFEAWLAVSAQEERAKILAWVEDNDADAITLREYLK